MAEVGSAFVSIMPSAKGFGSKLDSQVGGEIKSSGGRMGKVFGGAMKVGLVAAGAGLVAVGAAFKSALGAAAESEKITAQTASVLKSTGSVANVTADQVNKLGNEVSAYSGIADETVREGQNMLLTFTKVRNEVGKGNDVFTQATKLTTDMSVALGTDMKGAALQVGKALNDPTKGVTALARAGVSFTQQQKDQIKAMQESGDMLGAQKLILSELETQFGGSAKAAGDTFTGSINKLKNAFGDTLRDAVAPMLPKLTEFTLLIAKKLPGALNTGITFFKGLFDVFGQVRSGIQGVIASFGGGGGGGLVAAFQTAGAFITSQVVPRFREIVTAVQAFVAVALPIVQQFVAGMRARIEPMLPMIRQVFTQVGSIITGVMGLVKAVIQRVTAIVGGIWSRWGSQIMDFAAKAFGNVVQIISGALRIIQGIIKTVTSIIKGDWSGAWAGIKMIVSGAWTAIKGIVKQALLLLKTIVQLGWAALKAAAKAGIDKLVSDVRALPGQLKAALGNVGSLLYSAGVDLIQGMINGVKDMAGSIASAAADVVGNAISAAKSKLGIASPSKVFRQIGKWTMQGLEGGFKDGGKKVISRVESIVAAAVRRAGELRKVAQDFARTVAGTFSNDIFGNGAAGLKLQLQADTNDANKMLRALRLAEKKGLSGGLFKSLAASGDLNTAQQLAGMSRKQIEQYERMYAARNKATSQLGGFAEREMYGKALRENNQVVRQLTNKLDRLEGAVERGARKGVGDRGQTTQQRRRAGR